MSVPRRSWRAWRETLLLLALAPATALAAPTAEPDSVLRQRLVEAVQSSSSFPDRFAAEVWLADMADRMARYVPKAFPKLEDRLRFLRVLHAEATRAKVPPELALSVIEVESRFDRFAISSHGALGFMQIMPFWLKRIHRERDSLFNEQTNLAIGCTILRYYMDLEHGDLVKALQRYNGSYGKPGYPYKVLEALNRRWFRE
ncbi:MAG TPA: transglycosylase SLT domain-containing protein [Candidatus Binatia bacterium]|nr:transglycosylase SLT domain-containing protein [Candidatus Binatia bacterium]